jgi:REP element-mobilizing transposase RayT
MTTPERQLEENLIAKLGDLKYVYRRDIRDCMIFDGEQLTDLMEPLDLGWRERREKELALMDDPVPLPPNPKRQRGDNPARASQRGDAPASAAIPSAYLLTWVCYGTWLHGDERGSVSDKQNQFGIPRISPNVKWQSQEREAMSGPPIVLSPNQRSVVEETVKEVCQHRGWNLLAVNARSNHVHVVVSAGCPPEKTLADFKAWGTRRLRETCRLPAGRKVWAHHGSTRYLWTDRDVKEAVRYVEEGQDKHPVAHARGSESTHSAPPPPRRQRRDASPPPNPHANPDAS